MPGWRVTPLHKIIYKLKISHINVHVHLRVFLFSVNVPVYVVHSMHDLLTPDLFSHLDQSSTTRCHVISSIPRKLISQANVSVCLRLVFFCALEFWRINLAHADVIECRALVWRQLGNRNWWPRFTLICLHLSTGCENATETCKLSRHDSAPLWREGCMDFSVVLTKLNVVTCTVVRIDASIYGVVDHRCVIFPNLCRTVAFLLLLSRAQHFSSSFVVLVTQPPVSRFPSNARRAHFAGVNLRIIKRHEGATLWNLRKTQDAYPA